MLYRVFRGIRNFIAYAPIIWRDRDFDFAFLLVLLEFKLRRMSKFFLSADAYTKGAKECAEQMLKAATLAGRIADGEDDQRAGRERQRDGDMQFIHGGSPRS